MLAATTAWWLVGVGLLCILAAWFYTGGKRPYGYIGLGEVMVFVFFGLVAVLGTTYVQTESFELPALYAAIGVGAFACAILVANNLRDIPTDRVSGKRTLAVALGDERTRRLYGLLIGAALVALVGVALTTTWWALLASPRRRPTSARSRSSLGEKATGPALIPVLQLTGVAELLYAAGMFAGIAVEPGLIADPERPVRVRPPRCTHCGHVVPDPARHRRRLRPRLQKPRHAAREGARPVRDADQPPAQAQAPLSRPQSSSRTSSPRTRLARRSRAPL